ncbi:hypothetical protein ACQKDB_15945 [Planococcus kocurii]|uniref:hypothetical protein n=1 Tax=Planococcus kocurii TaxID=1374 RepID=UPI003D06D506
MKTEVTEIIKELRKIVPEANFRRQPDYSISFIVKMENMYKLNTSDFVSKNYDIEISEDDTFDWLNEFENFLMFKGDANYINTM